MKYIFIIIIGLFSGAFYAQDSAQDLLNKVVEKTSLVNDYSASVLIKPDVPMIKSLPVKAKIYFKKKDKFKVVSKSIAILPKQGFTDVNIFLSNPKNYMVVEAGTKMINHTNHDDLSLRTVLKRTAQKCLMCKCQRITCGISTHYSLVVG